MKNHRIIDKLKYHFDAFLSKGTIALILSLFVIMFMIVFIISLVLSIFYPDVNMGLLLWESFMKTLDPGNLSGDRGTALYMTMMTLATIVGIFITSLFISFILNGFQSKLENLSKGRSKVLESNHTLILGWTDNIYVIIQELIEANKSVKKPVIVILSERDSVAMNRDIKEVIRHTYNTKIICRNGSIYHHSDLSMCNIEEAKSVMILEDDLNTIKSLLVISSTEFFKKETGHISVLLNDKENINVAKNIGKDKLEVVYLSSAITRIITQTCLQAGLSQVYNELLEFAGDEIYFYTNESLIGKKFSEVLLMFEKSTVMGIYHEGKTSIRPPFDCVIHPDDQLIVIAADEDQIETSSHPMDVSHDLIVNKEHRSSSKVEYISIIGYNPKTLAVLKELNHSLMKGSKMKLLVNSKEDAEAINEIRGSLENIDIQVVVGETHSRTILDQFVDDDCQHIIIFANENMSVGDKDSQTLLTLLHLRDIEEKRKKNIEIISEISDVKNSDIIDLAKTDDFIISELLAWKMMTQISENRSLTAIFEELLSPEGSEIYLKPIEDYVKLGTPVDGYILSVAAIEKNEIAIGYKIRKEAHLPKVVINPSKSETMVFHPGDMIIVISED